MKNYDIHRPWMSLDGWQKEYIHNTDPNQDCFLLTGRQVGKTTAMAIKAVELCMKHFKKGEYVLINSITEKQAYHMLAKASVYAHAKYTRLIVKKGPEKQTKHRLMFKNGTGILCYAAGETGEGLRGLTIKKHMIDEGSRMSEEFFIATSPMLSVIGGSMDMASTPAGKHHKDGSEKFFYKCSKDKTFKKFYVSGEECPRHSKEFLEKEKKRLSELAYLQEYIAEFTDKVKQLFDEDLIKKICILKRPEVRNPDGNFYLGVDVAGFGRDECSYEIMEDKRGEVLSQVESITEDRNLTTDTSKKIIELNSKYGFRKIGIDDGGVGFGVWSELIDDSRTKRKTIALNNASRDKDADGKKHSKILKEEMYILLQVMMEKGRILLLNDEEIKASLMSIQHDDGKIFGSNAHITEGIIRAVWLAEKAKGLKLFCVY